MAVALSDIDPEDAFRLIILRKTVGEEFKRVAFVVRYAGLLDRKTLRSILNGSKWLLRQLEGFASVMKTTWLKNVVTEIVGYLRKAVSYGRLARWVKVYFVDMFVYYLSNAIALTSTFISVLSVLFG